MKYSIIYFLIFVSLVSCKPLKKKTMTTDIDFIISLFHSDKITRDKSILDNGFELSSETIRNSDNTQYTIEGFDKCCLTSGNEYEYITYSDDSENWLQYQTTNPQKISDILGSIKDHKTLKKVSEDDYSDGKINVNITRLTKSGYAVHSFLIYPKINK